MQAHNRNRFIKSTSAAGRTIMNDFVEAACAMAGNRYDGNGDVTCPGAAFVWGYDSVQTDVETLMNMALQAGAAAISLTFGRTHLEQGPIDIVVAVNDGGGHKMTYTGCAFWLAENDDTLVIVPKDMDACHGHFVVRAGRLERHGGWPSADLQPGIDRAAIRLRDAVASLRLRNGGVGTSMVEIRFAA